MNNRLQFRHHSEIFDSREAAFEYIQNGIRFADKGMASEEKSYGFSLLAEPTVLLYKNEENPSDPHMMLAIGSYTNENQQYGENRFCIIDTYRTYSEFEEFKKEIYATLKSLEIVTKDSSSLHLSATKEESGTTVTGDVKLAESYIFDDTVKRNNVIFVTENGLFAYIDIKFDKEANKISYQINGKTEEFIIPNNHLVSGEYSTEDESLHFHMSESDDIIVNLKQLLDEWDVDRNPSTPIVLSKETVGYGSEDRRYHSIEPWQDILSADVVLSDNDHNILVKSNNGKSLYVKGTADNISYLRHGKEITVADALDHCIGVSTDSENIIYRKEDGFTANVSLRYEKTENSLYFTVSNKDGEKKETKLALNSTNLYKTYYDPTQECIILQFITATGEIDERKIDLSAIIETELVTQNEGHSVALTKTRKSANGGDILSADVKISDSDNNILVEKDHALYVKGTANNIKYGTTTVKEALDTIKSDASDLANTVAKEAEDRKAGDKELSDKVTKLEEGKLESISAADSSIVVDKSDKLNPTVKVNVSSKPIVGGGNNLIDIKADGIAAYADLAYDEATNKITFTTTTGTTTYQLPSIAFIDDARYDHESEKIIITYHTNKGETKTIEIDVRDLVKEWDVTADTSGAIKLAQSIDESTGRHIISASTIVNTTHGDNMLVNDHGSLYVSSAEVKANTKAIDNLTNVVNDVKAVADAATEKNKEQDTKIETLRTDLDAEVALQAKHYTELFDEAATAKKGIADNKQAIKDEETRATAAEKANATDIANANQEIATLKTDLATEASTREAKDAAIENKVAVNAQAIETETDDRKKADNDINASIQTTNANLEAVTKTVDMLNGDASTVGSVREMIAHTKSDLENTIAVQVSGETTRATTAEEDLQKQITAHVSDAKTYTDAEIAKLDTKVTTEIATAKSEVIAEAEAKATELDNQVRKHAEDLTEAEKTRAVAAETANANDIKELQSVDAEIKTEVAKKIEKVTVVKDSQSDLQYILYVDDVKSGEINIPKDQFLKSVSYDEASKKLHFVFVTTEGEKVQDIEISHLVDVYTAGDGLTLTNNEFSVVLNRDTEKYLELTSEGLAIKGIESALASKANVGDSYTKAEVDTKATAVEKEITALSANVEGIDARVKTAETSIATLNGNASTEGSVKNAIKVAEEYADTLVKTNSEQTLTSAKAYTDEKVNAEKDRATNVENTISGNVKELKTSVETNTANIAANTANISSNSKDIKDLQTKVASAEGKIDTFSTEVQKVTDKVTAEVSRAMAAEATNATAIEKEETRATNAETGLTHLLNDETQARKDADALLDAAIKKATTEFNDTTSIAFSKTEATDKTSYSAAVRIATGENNIISNEKDGLHATVKLGYDEATNNIWLEKDNGDKLTSKIQLNAGSIIDSIVYDKENKILKINYTTAQGKTATPVYVPVKDLFNEWDVDNTGTDSGIQLKKTTSATETGVDLLSAKILISPIKDNLVTLDTNGLYVNGSGFAEISANTVCAQNEIDAIEDVLGVIGSCDTPIEYHKTTNAILSAATTFSDADQKLENAILETNKLFHDTSTASGYLKIENNEKTGTKDINVYSRISHGKGGSQKDSELYVTDLEEFDEKGDYNVLHIISVEDEKHYIDSAANGLYLSNVWDCGTYDDGDTITVDDYIKNFSN